MELTKVPTAPLLQSLPAAHQPQLAFEGQFLLAMGPQFVRLCYQIEGFNPLFLAIARQRGTAVKSAQKSYLSPIRIVPGQRRAVVFLHGFTGDQDDTWDRFPTLLGTQVADWDIYTVGYDTTLLPDITGLWTADPDLPIIATQFCTELSIRPLLGYSELTLIGHSMGGLVVQRALLDSKELRRRVSRVVLFGTPSLGLAKASWAAFWKRQLKNMSQGSKFITELRQDWAALGETLPFSLLVVAGSKDQFVPPDSSLGCFPTDAHRVVPGDHLQIVKPANNDSESLRLLISALNTADGSATPALSPPLRLLAEAPSSEARTSNIAAVMAASTKLQTEAEVVDAALAYERSGHRDKSIELLERHLDIGTDVQGTLGGRFKRMWLLSGLPNECERALNLYSSALARARSQQNAGQIYYNAINVAFMKFVAYGDRDGSLAFASEALAASASTEQDIWSFATQAEANLYLGRRQVALELYKMLPSLTKDGWKLTSAGQQAFHVARKLGDRDLADELDMIFSPGGGKIFMSYSHADAQLLTEFKKQLVPYLRGDPSRLAVWDDTMLETGEIWEAKLMQELEHCRSAVLLVSKNFTNSEFILNRELPILCARAENKFIDIYWFVLTPCAYDAIGLEHFQAAVPPEPALSELTEPERDRAFNKIAKRIARRDADRQDCQQINATAALKI